MEGFVDPSFASHFTSPPPNNQPSNTNDLLDFGDSATTSDGFAEFQSPPGGGPQHPQHVVKQVQSLNVTKGSFGGGFSNFDDGTRRPPQYETPTHQKIPSKSQMALHNNLKSTSSSPRIEIFQSQTPPPAMFDRGYSDNRNPNLPDPNLIVHSGTILSRISMRTIIMKKWKTTYYCILSTGKLFVFRSKDDFDDWRLNPYHSEEERQYLCKLSIDFVNDIRNPKVVCYRPTSVKQKSYENGVVHQFKLERMMDYGPNIAGAFASYNQQEVIKLHKEINECIQWAASGKTMSRSPPPTAVTSRPPNFAEGSFRKVSENVRSGSEGNVTRKSKGAFDFGSI